MNKASRRKRKVNEDISEAQEGGKMYAAGEFVKHGLGGTNCPPCNFLANNHFLGVWERLSGQCSILLHVVIYF